MKKTKPKLDEYYDVAEVAQNIESYLRANNAWTNKSNPLLIAIRYKSVIITEVGSNYAMRSRSDEKLDFHNVSMDRIRRALGKFGPKGKQQDWWPVLDKLCPMIRVAALGNNYNKHLTKVETMFEYDWEQQYVWTIRETVENDPEAETKYDWVDIDLENLGNYMLSAYSDRMRDSAAKIFAVAEQFRINDQWGRLPMLRKPAASGRMYYGGINLQNTPSAVRHAALGRHFAYDLRTSVFAWQVSMMRKLYGCDRNTAPPNTSYTREYLADKERIRNQFGDCFKDSYMSPAKIKETVKQALTAISFGARTTAAYINEHNELEAHGLVGIIKHKASRDAFVKHPWMAAFLKEQDKIAQDIFDATSDMFEVGGVMEKYRDAVINQKKRIDKKRLLAFLYQRAESQAMADIMRRVTDCEPILWVHDGFCTRHRIPFADINYILEQDHCEDWRLEETFHKGYRDPDEPKLTAEQQRLLNEQQDRAERAERIRAETEMWASRGVDTSGWRTTQQPMQTRKVIITVDPKTGKVKKEAPSPFLYEADDRTNYYNNVEGTTNTGLLNERQFIDRIYGKR